MSDLIELLQNPAVLVTACAVLGLLVGSFLNVVILRLPPRLQHDWETQGREVLGIEAPEVPATPPDLVFTPSHCPKCRHRLSAFENIPLFSWLVLRGRCRWCREKISWQYPLVEAITGIAFALCAAHFGFGWPLVVALVLTAILVAASGIDFRTQLLPDPLTMPLLWLGLLVAVYGVFVDAPTAILGAAFGYLVLWSVYWAFKLATGKEGMGYGDFKLLAALGAFVGYQGIIPILLMSSLVGAILGSIALAIQGRDRATPIPFGPFVAIAGWIWFLYGDTLFDAYGSLYGG